MSLYPGEFGVASAYSLHASKECILLQICPKVVTNKSVSSFSGTETIMQFDGSHADIARLTRGEFGEPSQESAMYKAIWNTMATAIGLNSLKVLLNFHQE